MDDREQRSGVAEALRSIPKLELQCTRLKLGDYLVQNEVLFERKTASDFAASILSGRLFS